MRLAFAIWRASDGALTVIGVIEDALVPIAAICGATLAVARAGLLNERRHTSNTPGYLGAHLPDYCGVAEYDSALAVNDRGVITASGLGPVDFARAIFAELGVFSASDEQVWYEMHKHGQLPRDTV
jgi:transcriptional regulator GlxA family with amidase domain